MAFCNILSKFTPILLSNIPFSPIQTWELHLACAWTSVVCLLLMSLVLVWGLVFVRWPAMPIDPWSLVGRVYFLCGSEAGYSKWAKDPDRESRMRALLTPQG